MSDQLKELAARRAVEYIREGMVVGLGTGSTAEFAIRALGERVAAGLQVTCVATSISSAALGHDLGLKIESLEDHPAIDLTIDGADEVDGRLDLTKGLGGALLREKIVAAATAQEIIIVDPTKLVDRLGTRGPLPVEVVPFGWTLTQRQLEKLGATVDLRLAGETPFLTDNGNYILHCTFAAGLEDAARAARAIDGVPGVVESGLFIGLTSRVVVGHADGTCQILERQA